MARVLSYITNIRIRYMSTAVPDLLGSARGKPRRVFRLLMLIFMPVRLYIVPLHMLHFPSLRIGRFHGVDNEACVAYS